MSTIKKNVLKTLLVIVGMIITMLLISTNSEAKYIGFGRSSVKASIISNRIAGDECVMGLPGNNTFCVQHGPTLYPGWYNIVNYVHIDGKKATSYTGNKISEIKTTTSDSNAIMAYILNQPDPGIYSAKQYNIWGYFPSWKNTLGIGIASTGGGSGSWSMVPAGQAYANTLPDDVTSEDEALIENKTENAGSNIVPEIVNGTEMIKIGPYKVEYKGDIDNVEILDQDNKAVSALYGKYEGTELKTSSDPKEIIKNGEEFYILVPGDGSVQKINKINIHVKLSINVITADVWVLSRGFGQNLITTSTDQVVKTTEDDLDLTPDGLDLRITLKLIKVNKDDHEVKLGGVGFIFQRTATGQYLKQEGDKCVFTPNKEEATVFVTDENGEINVEGVLAGNYTAYEVSNEHYGYEVATGVPIVVKRENNEDNVVIVENKQVKIKLSGYVWEDGLIEQKGGSIRNDLYADNTYDANDILLEGITVRLKNKAGEVLQECKTDENGAYLFEDVLIEDLPDLYIEFEYDGVVYKNVISNIEVDNGSKADEAEDTRANFNKDFTEIAGQDAQANIGQSKNEAGEKTHDLQYIRGEGEELYTSKLDYENMYFPITSNTNEAGYYINNHFKWGIEEIKYINQGLYRREQPDIALQKDLENAIVSINGYNHTYIYANKSKNKGDYESGFNVGVKFGSNVDATKYSRAIYKSDVMYTDDSEKDNELKVAVTYRISYQNQSSTLGVSVNSIMDYYDSDYEQIVGVGTGLDGNGRITGNLEYEEYGPYQNGYSRMKIYTDKKVLSEYEQDNEGTYETQNSTIGAVYVQFQMSREKVLSILQMNENEEPEGPLVNIAEIASYSVFDKDGNIYAGIDRDSAPDNVIIDDDNTYEDDTDIAPAFLLEYAGKNRATTGNVFEDLPEAKADFADGSTKPGAERLGNGRFEPDYPEPGISDVEIHLVEVDEQTGKVKTDENGNPVIAKDYSESEEGKEITATSGENGEYTLEGFVPKQYAVQFIWGGKGSKYTAINYKSTTMPQEEYSRKYEDAPEWDWYKEYKEDLSQDPRYSDAIDDQNIRNLIDTRCKDQVYGNTGENVDLGDIKMVSTSAPMNVTVEFSDLTVTETEVSETGTKDVFLEFTVPHVDFGIIERPRQDLELTKRVSALRLQLANGQILTDVSIDENGNVTGETESFTYIKPSPTELNGKVRIELDKELMAGAQLLVQYEIKATNASEIDYDDWQYYVYGTPSSMAVQRTLSANEVVDYLDTEWGYDETNQTNKENKWEEVGMAYITSKANIDVVEANGSTQTKQYDYFSPEVQSNHNTENRRILQTTVLAKDLLPNESATAYLEASKELASTDNISLNNEAEITYIHKEHGGREPSAIPGNYIARIENEEDLGAVESTTKGEKDWSMAETVIVTPPTGADAITYVIYTATAIIALAVLATGIVAIKKKALNK